MSIGMVKPPIRYFTRKKLRKPSSKVIKKLARWAWEVVDNGHSQLKELEGMDLEGVEYGSQGMGEITWKVQWMWGKEYNSSFVTGLRSGVWEKCRLP